MAKSRRRPKVGSDNESKIDAGGGGAPVTGWLSSTNTARNIGDFVADTTPVKNIGIPRSGGIRSSGRGSVYTPSGVYPAKETFVTKPPLSENQIRGIMQGQLTKQQNYLGQISNAGRRGAGIGLGVGGVAGVGATLATQKALDDARKAAAGIGKIVKKARGGGKNKR